MDDLDLDDIVLSDDESSILSSLTSDEGNGRASSSKDKKKPKASKKQASSALKSSSNAFANRSIVGKFDKLDRSFGKKEVTAIKEPKKQQKKQPVSRKRPANRDSPPKKSKRLRKRESDSDSVSVSDASTYKDESVSVASKQQSEKLGTESTISEQDGSMPSFMRSRAARAEREQSQRKENDESVRDGSVQKTRFLRTSLKQPERLSIAESKASNGPKVNSARNSTGNSASAAKRSSSKRREPEPRKSLAVGAKHSSKSSSSNVQSPKRASSSPQRSSSSKAAQNSSSKAKSAKSPPRAAAASTSPKAKRASSIDNGPFTSPHRDESGYRPYSPRKSTAISPELCQQLEEVQITMTADTGDSDSSSALPVVTGALFEPALDKRLQMRCQRRQASLHIIKTALETLESVVDAGIELSEDARTALFYAILKELRLRKAEVLVERLNQFGFLDFDDNEEWEVEEIVDAEDLPDGSRSYWIKWLGWRTLTLEPADKLTHCRQLVLEFDELRAGGRRRSVKARNTAAEAEAERSKQRSQIVAFLRVVRDKYKWTSEISLSELRSLVREVNGEVVGEFPREKPVVSTRKRSNNNNKNGSRLKTLRSQGTNVATDASEDERGDREDADRREPSVEVEERKRTELKNGRKCLTQLSKKQARGQREVARKFLREFEALLRRVYPKMYIRVENEVDNEVPPAHYEYVTEYKLGEGVVSMLESPMWCECPSNCWPVAAANASGTKTPATNGVENGSESLAQPPSVATSQTVSTEFELIDMDAAAAANAHASEEDPHSPIVPVDAELTDAAEPKATELAKSSTSTNVVATTKRKRGFDTPTTCCPASGAKLVGVDPSCAYDRNKRVNWEPGVIIFECGKKCKCDERCPNRVVQLGSKVRLCVFRTTDRGWGVKTLQYIPAGRFVIEYLGEVITNEEADRRGHNYDDEGLTFLFDLDLNDDDRSENSRHYTVDAKHRGNLTHFLNHSCDPNLAVYNVFIDSVDLALPRLALFATRAIMAGEELTFDYQRGKPFDDSILQADTTASSPSVLQSAQPVATERGSVDRDVDMDADMNALSGVEEFHDALSKASPQSRTTEDLFETCIGLAPEPASCHADVANATLSRQTEQEQRVVSTPRGSPRRSPRKVPATATATADKSSQDRSAEATETGTNKQQRRMKCLCKSAKCRGWLFLV